MNLCAKLCALCVQKNVGTFLKANFPSFQKVQEDSKSVISFLSNLKMKSIDMTKKTSRNSPAFFCFQVAGLRECSEGSHIEIRWEREWNEECDVKTLNTL